MSLHQPEQRGVVDNNSQDIQEYTSESGSDFTEYWIDWFLGMKGNEYFCDIDVEYITDRFNLTGLNSQVEKLSLLVDIITDNQEIDENQSEQTKARIDNNARFLYGLVHARYIITSRGLAKMLNKYRNGDFGFCPRVYCKLNPLLPIGLTDQPKVSPVKLYCSNCEDIYNPKSSRHSTIDGAFFGTSFPAMFLTTYPQLIPIHNLKIYTPKIFGFHLHDYAKLTRWKILKREQLFKELDGAGVKVLDCPGGFKVSTDEENEEQSNNSPTKKK
ncbi:hypothetical protein PACTADRAFT_49232 [Pachysolen tannophilus NRRL Y-2460]|uniref:Casein kinase II subunit beta n=1 Tax=Pachysolen tannophilus NRRL Y-2460 TaxID=669874 RepID=A0A1E4TVL5_PACTA|nr:hypothetical protein PACTADRAFT_49232 [Pachysolen tannophilus NRRL Y-2460]